MDVPSKHPRPAAGCSGRERNRVLLLFTRARHLGAAFGDLPKPYSRDCDVDFCRSTVDWQFLTVADLPRYVSAFRPGKMLLGIRNDLSRRIRFRPDSIARN